MNRVMGRSPGWAGLAAVRAGHVFDGERGTGPGTVLHAHAAQSVLDSARAGFTTVEHVSFSRGDGLDPDARTIDAMAASGAIASITALSSIATGKAPSKYRLAFLAEVLPALRSGGVRVVLSSDAGISESKPYDVLPRTLASMAESIGVSGSEAIRMVTANAAEACGMTGRKGTIAAGADADLLVVGADPVADLNALQDVRAVFRLGVRV